MNRILLAIASLLTMSTVLFTQQLVDSPDQRDILARISESTLVARQFAEFAPLNNVLFFRGGQKALETYLRDLNLNQLGQYEGTVNVQFRVLPTGHLTEINVLQSSEPQLRQIAIQAVRQFVGAASLCVLPLGFTSLTN